MESRIDSVVFYLVLTGTGEGWVMESDVTRRSHPDRWLSQVFSAKAVERGGVVRRNRDWVDNEIGRDRFVAECRKRGFGLLEVGGQFVVICSRKPIRRLV